MSEKDELHRPELIHRYLFNKNDFIDEIDRTGGGPLGYTHVSFFHSMEQDGRKCKFGMKDLRQPYWTTVLTSDEYYFSKLSAKKILEIESGAKKAIAERLMKEAIRHD